MSLQDRTVVRTATGLEKKYNLFKLAGLATNPETNGETLIKVQNELNNFIISTTSSLENMETEIDGKVTTWYYSGVPSLSNSPASTWTTDEERNKHIGDLYYDQSTGYCYRFQYSDSAYSWANIKDDDITQAMALANAAQDTADNKRRIFVAQPTTPYDNGDLWVQGSNGEIMVCQLSRAEGSYDAGDWIVASKYTDDTVANAIVDEMGGTTTTVLGGTVTQYTKNWVKFTDLSTGGSTTIAGENIKTGTIDASKVKIANNNVVLDKDGIKLSNGAKVIGNNGLKNTYLFDNSNSFNFIGFQAPGYGIGEVAQKWSSTIEFAIPKGLEITKATMRIYHNPVVWYIYDYESGSEETIPYVGYSRNVKLYKAIDLGTRMVTAVYGSEYRDSDSTTYTNTGVTWYNTSGTSLGTSFTAPVATTESYNMTEAITSDFSNIFKSNGSTVPGIYQVKLETEETPSSSWGDAECAVRTGKIYAMLEIEGYMTYS